MQTVTVQKDGVGTLVPPIKGKGECEHRGMVPVTSVWAAHLTLSVSGCGRDCRELASNHEFGEVLGEDLE
mgnify:CR=1 FL=1